MNWLVGELSHRQSASTMLPFSNDRIHVTYAYVSSNIMTLCKFNSYCIVLYAILRFAVI